MIVMKSVMIISDGFEDLEVFTTASILRRADVPLTIATLSSMVVTSSSGIRITADMRVSELDISEYDMILLPSFEGMENSQKITSLVKEFNKDGKFIVAMSHAPIALAKAGVLENKLATVYDGMESKIPRPRDARIVIDGNIITSRSPSDVQELALKLVEISQGKATAKRMRERLG